MLSESACTQTAVGLILSELYLYKTNRSNDANNALPVDNLNLIKFLDPCAHDTDW